MIPLSRTTAVRLLLMAAMTAAVGCRDRIEPTGPTRTWSMRSSATISDGAHNQGNDDVFFLPPMVPNPSGAAGYGDPFQPGLPVSIKICVVPSADPCTSHVQIFAPDAVKSSSEGFYNVNWDTKAVGLDPSLTYRIEVWVRSTRVAFADVDVVSSGSQLKNVNTNEFIPLLDGRTLPIKVRIEQGWNCKNNASCVTQEVTNTPPAGQDFTIVKSNDGENAVAFPADWHDGDTPVLVTVEDVTESLRLPGGASGCSLSLTKMLTSGNCVKITVDPPVTVAAGKSVIVAVCQEDRSDVRQRLLKYDVGEAPKFLRNVPVPPGFICPETQIGAAPSSNPFARFASAAYSRLAGGVNWLFGARTAYAIDVGVGGSIDGGDGFSVISAGLPATMEAVAGQNQTATAGSTVPVAPKVKLVPLHPASGPNSPPAPLVGFDVTCQVTGGGGSLIVDGSSVQSATVQTDAQGFAECPSWKLGDVPGENHLLVSAARLDQTVTLAELGEEGPEEDTFPGTVVFNATGVAVPNLLSPPDFSVFSIFPRATTLTWSAVPGAVSYQVQVDFCGTPPIPIDPLQCPGWSPWRDTSVEGTTFNFDFVGAQPGRWRVRANFSGGVVGPFSAYRYFRYTI